MILYESISMVIVRGITSNKLKCKYLYGFSAEENHVKIKRYQNKQRKARKLWSLWSLEILLFFLFYSRKSATFSPMLSFANNKSESFYDFAFGLTAAN